MAKHHEVISNLWTCASWKLNVPVKTIGFCGEKNPSYLKWTEQERVLRRIENEYEALEGQGLLSQGSFKGFKNNSCLQPPSIDHGTLKILRP